MKKKSAEIVTTVLVAIICSSCVGPQVIRSRLSGTAPHQPRFPNKTAALVLDGAFVEYVHKIPAGFASYDFEYGKLLSKQMPLSLRAVFCEVTAGTATDHIRDSTFIVHPQIPTVRAKVGITGKSIPTDIEMRVKLINSGDNSEAEIIAKGHSDGKWGIGSTVVSIVIPVSAVSNAMKVMSRSQDKAITDLLDDLNRQIIASIQRNTQ